jgi:hypothetical protein
MHQASRTSPATPQATVRPPCTMQLNGFHDRPTRRPPGRRHPADRQLVLLARTPAAQRVGLRELDGTDEPSHDPGALVRAGEPAGPRRLGGARRTGRARRAGPEAGSLRRRHRHCHCDGHAGRGACIGRHVCGADRNRRPRSARVDDAVERQQHLDQSAGDHQRVLGGHRRREERRPGGRPDRHRGRRPQRRRPARAGHRVRRDLQPRRLARSMASTP